VYLEDLQGLELHILGSPCLRSFNGELNFLVFTFRLLWITANDGIAVLCTLRRHIVGQEWCSWNPGQKYWYVPGLGILLRKEDFIRDRGGSPQVNEEIRLAVEFR